MLRRNFSSTTNISPSSHDMTSITISVRSRPYRISLCGVRRTNERLGFLFYSYRIKYKLLSAGIMTSMTQSPAREIVQVASGLQTSCCSPIGVSQYIITLMGRRSTTAESHLPMIYAHVITRQYTSNICLHSVRNSTI